jgi:hypothetical protein
VYALHDPLVENKNYIAYSIIHELMHAFTSRDSAVGEDHFGTAWCEKAMGYEQDGADNFHQMFVDNFGICPLAFNNFSQNLKVCD